MPEFAKASVDAIARIDAVPLILEVACRMTGMGFAAIARVTDDRWIACAVHDRIAFGLKPGGELEVATTLCSEVRNCGREIVIDHVAVDPVYRDHATPAMYGLQSYISIPIARGKGELFGTLCAIDPSPQRVSDPVTLGTLRLFADLVAMHLDTHERLERSEAALLDERATSELRDQFIAVLGHDLRNPLAAIEAGTVLLDRAALPPREASVVRQMRDSASRMAALIDDVLDLARGTLGGGLDLDRAEHHDLAAALSQVVDELRAVHPDRPIDARISCDHPVRCDPQRIKQLLSNLLGNALTHGAADGAIQVDASCDDTALRIVVANGGEPIDAALLPHLFKPFRRNHKGGRQEGLGLGLFIASEIARAHGGTLDVESDASRTLFAFSMPHAADASPG